MTAAKKWLLQAQSQVSGLWLGIEAKGTSRQTKEDQKRSLSKWLTIKYKKGTCIHSWVLQSTNDLLSVHPCFGNTSQHHSMWAEDWTAFSWHIPGNPSTSQHFLGHYPTEARHNREHWTMLQITRSRLYANCSCDIEILGSKVTNKTGQRDSLFGHQILPGFWYRGHKSD